MKYLSIVKGNDYALSLIHYIRHGRKCDCIICLDDVSDKVLSEFNIVHVRKDEIYNVYISKVIYTMRYQREVNDTVCYQDVFVNFDDYNAMESFIDRFTFKGLLVADRKMYWPYVEKNYLPICKCMYARDIPEKAEKEYLSNLTTTEDSIYKDFTYSYYNDSWAGWYSHLLNGWADDEVTLQLSKNCDWYSQENWAFYKIRDFYNETYLRAGHDLLYMNIYGDNTVLHIDEDLYKRYSVGSEDALKRVAHKVIYKIPEVQKVVRIE